MFQIGTIAVVKQLVKLPGKVVRVLVERDWSALSFYAWRPRNRL